MPCISIYISSVYISNKNLETKAAIRTCNLSLIYWENTHIFGTDLMRTKRYICERFNLYLTYGEFNSRKLIIVATTIVDETKFTI